MQIKEVIMESKIQNMSRLFAAVGNQEFVALSNIFHQDEPCIQSSDG